MRQTGLSCLGFWPIFHIFTVYASESTWEKLPCLLKPLLRTSALATAKALHCTGNCKGTAQATAVFVTTAQALLLLQVAVNRIQTKWLQQLGPIRSKARGIVFSSFSTSNEMSFTLILQFSDWKSHTQKMWYICSQKISKGLSAFFLLLFFSMTFEESAFHLVWLTLYP